MYLTYKPDGQEAQQFLYEPGKLRVAETEAIEERTGMPYGGDFKLSLLKGQVRARRALLWTFLRRQHPNIRFEDVDFADDEVTLELDRDEIQAELDALADATGIKAEDRLIAETVYREQLKTAPAAPPKAVPAVSGKSTD